MKIQRNIFFCSKKEKRKSKNVIFFLFEWKTLLDEVDEDQKITTWRIKKQKHNNQNHRRILAIVDLIVYLMPIRPRGAHPEVLVVRGKARHGAYRISSSW